jgi:hypothetical protein
MRLRAAWTEQRLSPRDVEVLIDHCLPAPRRRDIEQTHWIPDRDEIELGHRLLPVVLSLRAAATRAIYPTTPKDGLNPAISVSHFIVPAAIARKLWR